MGRYAELNHTRLRPADQPRQTNSSPSKPQSNTDRVRSWRHNGGSRARQVSLLHRHTDVVRKHEKRQLVDRLWGGRGWWSACCASVRSLPVGSAAAEAGHCPGDGIHGEGIGTMPPRAGILPGRPAPAIPSLLLRLGHPSVGRRLDAESKRQGHRPRVDVMGGASPRS